MWSATAALAARRIEHSIKLETINRIELVLKDLENGRHVYQFDGCVCALARCIRVSEISGSEIGIFELGNN